MRFPANFAIYRCGRGLASTTPAMKLVKGATVDIQSRDEECFRFPAQEPIAEISCGNGVSCGDDEDDRPAVAFARGTSERGSANRSLRVRGLHRGGDLGFAYQS